jgi:hypothetical protein
VGTITELTSTTHPIEYDRLDFHIKAAASYYQIAADCFRRADVALEQLPRIQPSESGKARLGLWMGKGRFILKSLCISPPC